MGRPFHPWGGIFDSVAVLGYNIGLEKAGGPSPLVGADPRQGAEQGFPVFLELGIIGLKIGRR